MISRLLLAVVITFSPFTLGLIQHFARLNAESRPSPPQSKSDAGAIGVGAERICPSAADDEDGGLEAH